MYTGTGIPCKIPQKCLFTFSFNKIHHEYFKQKNVMYIFTFILKLNLDINPKFTG